MVGRRGGRNRHLVSATRRGRRAYDGLTWVNALYTVLSVLDPQGHTLDAVLRSGGEGATAIVSPQTGTSLTFGRLREETHSLAGRLAYLGVRRGDRVAFVLDNSSDALQATFAITLAGAAAAPLNPAYTFEEFAFYLGDIAPRFLLVAEGESEAARRAAPEAIDVIELGHDTGWITLRGRHVISKRAHFEAVSPHDEALVLHTSGTTSRPKQVPLLHRNLLASARTIVDHYQLTDRDVSYCLMPLFHVHGFVASALAALLAGGQVVVPARVNARLFASEIARYGVTWFSAAPTLHLMLLDKAPSVAAPGSLRFVRSCSAPLSAEVFERAESVWGVPMLESYGMTEASHQIASNPLPPRQRIAQAVGLPTGTEIRIAAPEARKIGNATGEVLIRGPNLTSGYVGNPDANAAAFVDGWFRTGDIGIIGDDGYLSLRGRIKELIIRGGENISPYEIEEILSQHPAISEVVCFGLPDVKYGERVAAAVVLKHESTALALQKFCYERIARFKVPTIFILPALPRTATGKLQRKQLAEIVSTK